MSEKKLRAHTIIPDRLYVQRAADRQLEHIIEDMGRPGYVLVARQMGKTNLLLNARRSFAKPCDVFAYLDVSNTYPDLESFFRNIIDVVLESADEKLVAATEKIAIQRSSKKLLPHKEHETELRIILRSIEGKLVICLDEIDALTKTTYSDQAFSLIRSIYFSGRANFPEFSRLTYILSGVAEPTEIIKNKEISPFNIGEKIYLEDFSVTEFDEFLKKAGLTFTTEVSSAIYSWTNGNPRITWDLCSAVEDYSLEKGSIEADNVSAIVQKLYLTTFDLPPIDHIRKLVEDDKDIRAAIMSIHYGKSESIPDPLRSRLYLAGICRFDTQNRGLYIKNNIIEAALSEEWIRQVDRQRFSIEQMAKNYFDDGNYEEAAKAYLEFIEQTTDSVAKSIPYYNVGLSYYYRGDYSNAIRYLSVQPLKKNDYPKQHLNSLFIIGLCNFQLKNYVPAQKMFELVLQNADEAESPYEYFEALSSLASTLFNSDKQNALKAMEQYDRVIEAATIHLQNATNDDSDWVALAALARSNLAQVLRGLGKLDAAKEELRLAAEMSTPSAKPERLVQLASMEKDLVLRRQILSDAVNCIIENKLMLGPDIDHVRRLSLNKIVPLIRELNLIAETEQIKRLLSYFLSTLKKHSVDSYQLVERITLTLFETKDVDVPRYWLERLLDPSVVLGITGITKKFALTCLVVINQENPYSYKKAYLESVQEAGNTASNYDFAAFYLLITACFKDGDFDEASAIVSRLDFLCTNSPELVEEGGLILSYLTAATLLYKGAVLEGREQANDFIKRAKRSTNFRLPFFDRNFSATLINIVRNLLGQTLTRRPMVRIDRKIGRNEVVQVKFTDGRVVRGKYKSLSDLLERGECEFFSE